MATFSVCPAHTKLSLSRHHCYTSEYDLLLERNGGDCLSELACQQALFVPLSRRYGAILALKCMGVYRDKRWFRGSTVYGFVVKQQSPDVDNLCHSRYSVPSLYTLWDI